MSDRFTAARTASICARSRRGGQPQVLPQGAGEHRGLLLDVPELAAQRLPRQVAHVDPGHAHRPGGHVVEPLGELQQRRLARARRADQAVRVPYGTVNDTSRSTGSAEPA
jgi:hypothetical protein